MSVNNVSFAGQNAKLVGVDPRQNANTPYASPMGTFGTSDIELYGEAQQIALAPTSAFTIPGGTWMADSGLYSDIQTFDPRAQIWRNLTGVKRNPRVINSDGTNWRFANLSGCPVGALITNGGANASNAAGFYPATGTTVGGVASTTGYSIAASAGGSTWNFWVGGAMSTTITITTAGTLYTIAPIILILPPAAQGNIPYVPATAYCTISAGAIATVVVTNQGAGYVAAPIIAVINAIGDTTGTGGVLTATIGNATAVTAIVMASPGTVRTAVPTLTITTPGGSPAATVVMNFSLGVIVTIGGAGGAYGNAQAFQVIASGGQITTTPTYTNPAIEKGLTVPRQPYITGISEAGGTIIAADLSLNLGSYMDFGAGFQTSPTLIFVGSGATTPTSQATATTVVGGQNDVVSLWAV